MKGSGDDSGGYMEEEVPSWRLVAKVCFIPKEENSTDINQFPTISLLNVKGFHVGQLVFEHILSKRGFQGSLFVLSIEHKNH